MGCTDQPAQNRAKPAEYPLVFLKHRMKHRLKMAAGIRRIAYVSSVSNASAPSRYAYDVPRYNVDAELPKAVPVPMSRVSNFKVLTG